MGQLGSAMDRRHQDHQEKNVGYALVGTKGAREKRVRAMLKFGYHVTTSSSLIYGIELAQPDTTYAHPCLLQFALCWLPERIHLGVVAKRIKLATLAIFEAAVKDWMANISYYHIHTSFIIRPTGCPCPERYYRSYDS